MAQRHCYDADGRVGAQAHHDVMDLVAQKVITPTQAFLYTVIARAASDDGGWTNLSHEQLADRIGLKPGMLRVHLKQLTAKHLVGSRSRRGEGQAKDYRPLAPISRTTGGR